MSNILTKEEQDVLLNIFQSIEKENHLYTKSNSQSAAEALNTLLNKIEEGESINE